MDKVLNKVSNNFSAHFRDTHWWKVMAVYVFLKLIHISWALFQLSIKMFLAVHPILAATPYVQSISRGFTALIELTELIFLSPHEINIKSIQTLTKFISNFLMLGSSVMVFLIPPIGAACFAGASLVSVIKNGINLKNISDSGNMSKEYSAARTLYIRSLMTCAASSIGCTMAMAGAGLISVSPPVAMVLGFTAMTLLTLGVISSFYNVSVKLYKWHKGPSESAKTTKEFEKSLQNQPTLSSTAKFNSAFAVESNEKSTKPTPEAEDVIENLKDKNKFKQITAEDVDAGFGSNFKKT